MNRTIVIECETDAPDGLIVQRIQSWRQVPAVVPADESYSGYPIRVLSVSVEETAPRPRRPSEELPVSAEPTLEQVREIVRRVPHDVDEEPVKLTVREWLSIRTYLLSDARRSAAPVPPERLACGGCGAFFACVPDLVRHTVHCKGKADPPPAPALESDTARATPLTIEELARHASGLPPSEKDVLPAALAEIERLRARVAEKENLSPELVECLRDEIREQAAEVERLRAENEDQRNELDAALTGLNYWRDTSKRHSGYCDAFRAEVADLKRRLEEIGRVFNEIEDERRPGAAALVSPRTWEHLFLFVHGSSSSGAATAHEAQQHDSCAWCRVPINVGDAYTMRGLEILCTACAPLPARPPQPPSQGAQPGTVNETEAVILEAYLGSAERFAQRSARCCQALRQCLQRYRVLPSPQVESEIAARIEESDAADRS